MRNSRSGAAVLLVGTLLGAVGVVVSSPVQAAGVTGPNPAAVLARMTEAQQVGQLIMVGAALSGVSTATRSAISDYHVGSVILTGRSSAGTASVHQLSAGLQALAEPGGVPLFVATDQEGGEVQTLTGPGFDLMPTAVAQGRLAPTVLRTDAIRWGGQLAAAGVNLDLAPVLDTVPADETTTNQPIGRYDREYGTTPGVVTVAGTAVVQGLHLAGVETAIKHFPGLGRADGNTDVSTDVTDDVTTRYDAYLAPYAAAIRSAGTGVVMVSLATYTRIDPAHRAVFSPTVLQGMLRDDLGFTGVIMSDSMDAAEVSDLTPGERAVDFVAAGGDLVLTTVPTDVPAMVSALLHRAGASAAFRAQVAAACLLVLIAKQHAGLLGGALAAAAPPAGLVDLAERSGTGVGLFTRSAAAAWSGPVALGADTRVAPALAARPGSPLVYAAEVTAAHTVALRSYRPGATSAGWQQMGGQATSGPGLAADRTGRLALAVRGADLAVWLREFVPATGWTGWLDLGGVATGAAPALVYTPAGDLEAFIVGEGQGLYRDVRHDGRWSGWVNLGGDLDSGAAATVSPTGVVNLYAQGGGASLVTLTVGAGGWRTLAGVRAVAAPAAALTSGGSTVVVVEGSGGRLESAVRSATGAWSGWTYLPFD